MHRGLEAASTGVRPVASCLDNHTRPEPLHSLTLLQFALHLVAERCSWNCECSSCPSSAPCPPKSTLAQGLPDAPPPSTPVPAFVTADLVFDFPPYCLPSSSSRLLPVPQTQGFSTSVLLTLGLAHPLLWERLRMFNYIPGLYPGDACTSLHPHPNGDKWKCLQIWPDVPWVQNCHGWELHTSDTNRCSAFCRLFPLYRNVVPAENPVIHTHIPFKSAQKSPLPSPTLTSLFQIQFLPTPNPDPLALFSPEDNTRPPPAHCRTFPMVIICYLSSLSECHLQEARTSAWLVHQWILGAYNRIWSLEAGNDFLFLTT